MQLIFYQSIHFQYLHQRAYEAPSRNATDWQLLSGCRYECERLSV